MISLTNLVTALMELTFPKAHYFPTTTKTKDIYSVIHVVIWAAEKNKVCYVEEEWCGGVRGGLKVDMYNCRLESQKKTLIKWHLGRDLKGARMWPMQIISRQNISNTENAENEKCKGLASMSPRPVEQTS